jgi:hypothetical protein
MPRLQILGTWLLTGGIKDTGSSIVRDCKKFGIHAKSLPDLFHDPTTGSLLCAGCMQKSDANLTGFPELLTTDVNGQSLSASTVWGYKCGTVTWNAVIWPEPPRQQNVKSRTGKLAKYRKMCKSNFGAAHFQERTTPKWAAIGF